MYVAFGKRFVLGFHVTLFDAPSQLKVPAIGGDEDIEPSVAGLSMGSENAMTMSVVFGTLTELFAGVVFVTEGGLGTGPVVNEKTNGSIMLVPNWLFAPVPIVIVYFVFPCRSGAGSHVMAMNPASHEKLPAIGGEAEVAPSVEEVFIGIEKWIVTFV
jgi:hypothetical protein